MPIGTIILWKNATIPTGWAVCDGVHADVPNIVGRLVMGATLDSDLRAIGGAEQHKHSGPTMIPLADHNHGGTMTITVNNGGGSQWTTSGAGVGFGVAGSHNHGSTGGVVVGDGGGHNHTVPDTDYADNVPPHIKRVFIRRVS